MANQEDLSQGSGDGVSMVAPAAIVGIGASAGGLEAIQAFFQAMPADSGMAFVVVQHLSPDYKSLMVELLSRKTEMPVHRVDEGVLVLPNNVYLIPPRMNLTIFHGRLMLQEQYRGAVNLPVDIFLHSLAEDQGEKAVAVILSGTGSDGTRGSRAIKEAGGLVLVQDERTAKFDGMPRAAQSTGVADFVLPPEEMPAQLISCLRHPYVQRPADQEHGPDVLRVDGETAISRLFAIVRARTKVDFTYYKPTTVLRRIERRVAITQSEDFEAYVRYLESTPSEVSALYRELLIGVTSFFRDTHVMEELRDRVLPDVLQNAAGREVRFWVAGCSTGEEAYTLAILTREVMESLGISRDVKIFATDVDREAVAKAGAGVYPDSIAADLTPQLLSKYFYSTGDTYRVARNIREMVVFAQHNLTKDPPFTRTDLVSCRNLLIYLQNNLQQHVLSMFSFSLNPGGVLVLGTSETVGELEEHFEPIDRKAKIYRALGRQRLRRESHLSAAEVEVPPLSDVSRALGRKSQLVTREHDRVASRMLEAVASIYAPLSVVVNEHLEILHIAGDPSGIFTLPSGKAVLDISKMVNRELAIPLATGIQKVFRTGEELIYSGIRVRNGSETVAMRLRIRLVQGRKNEEPLGLVVFEAVLESGAESLPGGVACDLDEETRQRLHDIEQELQFTRENLQATIEELETSNEELQATNEELLASNEELQSTNEELQSTNEELHTVNTEYQSKIIELTESQNDVDNLLSSSRIGTVILDEDLRIRRYSPQAAKVFNITPIDTGRPLMHLTHNLENFDAGARAFEVQRSGVPYEGQARSQAGGHYLARILPYQIAPGAFAGVVITVIDVTPLKEATAKVELALQSELDVVEHMPTGLFVYEAASDGDFVLVSGNKAGEKLSGVKVSESVGRSFRELWPGESGRKLASKLLEVGRTGATVTEPEMRYEDERFSGVFSVVAFPLPGGRVAVGFEDLGERQQLEARVRRAARQQESQLRLLQDAEVAARMGSWTWDVAEDKVDWSDNLYRLFRRDPGLGAPSFAEHAVLYNADSMDLLREAVARALQPGEPYALELIAVRSDGTKMRCIARGIPEFDERGQVVRVYGSLQEVG